GGDVVDQRRPGDEQRSARREPLQLERRHRAAGPAVEDHGSARLENGQAVVERGLAHAVVHRRRPGPAGDLAGHSGELAVAGDVISPGAPVHTTVSPAANPETPGPTAVTVPAPSAPGVNGS